MAKDTALITRIDIPLAAPVTVPGADGKEAERSTITMRRPKLRHAKRVAALIGEDVLAALLDGTQKSAATEIDGRAFAVDIIGKLLSKDRLDELTAIIADMCGEDVAVIDDLDPVDLPQVAMAFVGFFPELRSKALSWSAASLAPGTGGSRAS